MPATHTPAAFFAAALVDANLAANGLGGDVGLKLFVDVVILLDVTAAIGTGVGQCGFERFVDGIRGGGGRWPCCAVLFAGFPPGVLGCSLGGPLENGAA